MEELKDFLMENRQAIIAGALLLFLLIFVTIIVRGCRQPEVSVAPEVVTITIEEISNPGPEILPLPAVKWDSLPQQTADGSSVHTPGREARSELDLVLQEKQRGEQ